MRPITFGIILIALPALLAACQMNTQATSGRAYLEKYDGIAATTGGAMEPEIRLAADVEPALKFPARIGLARIENGRMSTIPDVEAVAWIDLAKRLGPKFGEFVPISPLVVSLASTAGSAAPRKNIYGYQGSAVARTVKDVRLGAARHHVDVVLIYEVHGRKSDQATILSVADITIVGAFLMPSRSLQATGTAQAILVDVRNGYHYGNAQASVTDTDFVPSVGSTERTRSLEFEAKSAAAVKLTENVETMAERLYLQLAQTPEKSP